jgi:hypothetical protein
MDRFSRRVFLGRTAAMAGLVPRSTGPALGRPPHRARCPKRQRSIRTARRPISTAPCVSTSSPLMLAGSCRERSARTAGAGFSPASLGDKAVSGTCTGYCRPHGPAPRLLRGDASLSMAGLSVSSNQRRPPPCLLASGQITMRKVDGWQTLSEKPIAQCIDLAA